MYNSFAVKKNQLFAVHGGNRLLLLSLLKRAVTGRESLRRLAQPPGGRECDGRTGAGDGQGIMWLLSAGFHNE